MRTLLDASIARRLAGALLLACALVWGAIYAMRQHSAFRSGSGSFDTEMLVISKAISLVLDRPPGTQPEEFVAALHGISATLTAEVKVVGSPEGFLAFQVHDAHGVLIGRGGYGPPAIQAPDDLGGFFESTFGDQRYRILRRWTAAQRFRVDATQSLTSRQQIFNAVTFSRDGLVNPVLIGLPLLLFPVLFAVYSGLKPLRRLSNEMAARHPSDLRPLRTPYLYQELKPVVQELNGTMARLSAMLQREREFLADAAHELRTPLALISVQCDTLVGANELDERNAAARSLRSGVERSIRLVNQLLSLARLDTDLEDVLMPTDVAVVVRDCLAACAQEAKFRSTDVAYVGPDSLVTLCPGHAIESVVSNLVSNAIRYGQMGGLVEVRVARTSRERLFESFRRGSNPGASGSGLGLAIVASAARQLNARIALAEGPKGVGLSVCLSWPYLHPEMARPSDGSTPKYSAQDTYSHRPARETGSCSGIGGERQRSY
jgi:two-component system, OmpR family, sensor histidine kinase QseC